MVKRLSLVLLVLMLAAGCSSQRSEPPPPKPAEKPATPAQATPAPPPPPKPAEKPATSAGPATTFEEAAADQPGYDEVSAMEVPEADPKAGAEVFSSRCATCHGEDGATPGPGAVGLDPQPRNLTAPGEYRYGADLKGIYRTARFGVKDSPMTPWDGLLTDEELWNVAAYVKSLQR